MQYNQPFGVSDTNAAYVNGNPSTGQAGSIPPAAAIEHDQREIVNVISATGQTPSSSILNQLARGIQSGLLNFATAGGTANALTVALPIAPASYFPGLVVRVLIVTPNTGPVTINVNGLGVKSVIQSGGAPLVAGDLPLNQVVELFYEGTAFRSAASRPTFSKVEVFTASGTFTVKTAGPHRVTIIGGGASGGFRSNYPSGGGGAGGRATKIISGLVVGSTVPVTIGSGGAKLTAVGVGNPGGTSSFGSYASATGGGGGGINDGGAHNSAGGAGGVGISGDLNTSGAFGGDSIAIAQRGGDGGGPGSGRAASGYADGLDASGDGGGGGGGGSIDTSGTAGATGGAGFRGSIIVEY